MPTTKWRTAMYGLESSDTSDTPVEEGAAVRAGAPDFTILMLYWRIEKQALKTML